MSTHDHTRMPAVFVGHGSPMNAIEDNEFAAAWAELGRTLPRPRAILSVSAHWESDGTQVTAMERPSTIHDFYGFPDELYRLEYPAPGSPSLARRITELPATVAVKPDAGWGLDHGTWSVLHRMYPDADIPVVQLSLDRTQPPRFHFELGGALQELRDEGVLILGSGNVVHNLGAIEMMDGGFDWAEAFDATVADAIDKRNFDALVDYTGFGRPARLAVPTNEHYLPLLYVLGSIDRIEPVRFFCGRCVMGSLSMRGVVGG